MAEIINIDRIERKIADTNVLPTAKDIALRAVRDVWSTNFWFAKGEPKYIHVKTTRDKLVSRLAFTVDAVYPDTQKTIKKRFTIKFSKGMKHWHTYIENKQVR